MSDAEREELDRYRRQDLLQRMHTISKEQWDSGWQVDLEHDLYLMVFEQAPADYGMGVIEPGALAEVKRLAELTQAWWVFDNPDAAPAPIALEEAERRFSKLIAEDEFGALHRMSVAEAKLIYDRSSEADWELQTLSMPWESTVWHFYRLKTNHLFTIHPNGDEGDWQVRFGGTGVVNVAPAWAKAP